MKTESQLRAEIYTAISNIVPTYWLSKPLTNSVFPCIVYSMLNSSSTYSFGTTRQAEDRAVQIDLYVNPSAVTVGDTKQEAIKTAMEAINYRQVGSSSRISWTKY